MNVKHYHLDFSQELVEIIDVTLPDKYSYFPIYSLKIPNVSSGDIVQASTQFEIANDWTYTVSLAHVMMVNRTEEKAIGITDAPGKPMAPCFHAGSNVTPGGGRMHYGLRAFTGMTEIDWQGDAWVSIWVYAKSDTGSDGTLKVGRGGGLSALHFKN